MTACESATAKAERLRGDEAVASLEARMAADSSEAAWSQLFWLQEDSLNPSRRALLPAARAKRDSMSAVSVAAAAKHDVALRALNQFMSGR